MADLDAQIRELLVGMRPRRFGSFTPDPHGPIEAWLNATEAAILAVLDLHKPIEGQTYVDRPCSCMPDPDDPYVAHPWPCPTVRAIAAAFGIEVHGD